MPLTGGIIGIGILRGLESYDESKELIQGIKVSKYRKSKKSYFTFKIDNIDMAEKDVRIISFDGTPMHVGRVEFRLNGVWGSVCIGSSKDSAAKKICQDLKYKTGFIKNTPYEEDKVGHFCKNFNKENYCGPDASPIHYMNLNCDGEEKSIMDCQRDIAQECKHSDDLIIECSNEDMEKAEKVQIGNKII